MQRLPLLVPILVVFLPVNAPAELSEEAKSWIDTIKRNTVTYSGASSPESIPLQSRLDAYFRNHYGPNQIPLSNQLVLTTEDEEKLSGFASQTSGWEANKSLEVSRKWHSVCANLDRYDPVTAAQILDDMENTYRLEKHDRYQQLLSSLSLDAQVSIVAYISERVLPGMSVSKIDLVGIAAENPKAFGGLLRYRCSPTSAELAAHKRAFEETVGSQSHQESTTSDNTSEIGSLPN